MYGYGAGLGNGIYVVLDIHQFPPKNTVAPIGYGVAPVVSKSP
jgi:hypothetical protein